MWIYSTDGFMSVVEDKHNPDRFCVRARHKQHLLNLGISADQIVGPTEMDHPHPDYPWRTFQPKVTFVNVLINQVEAINYPDFKTAVKQQAGGRTELEYLHALGAIWSISHEFERR